jgi:hypothetical protein
MPPTYPYLDLAVVESFVYRMQKAGVSEVARSKGGFLPAFRKAGGDPSKLSVTWRKRRDAFIARHIAQANANGEELIRATGPSRRHLALIAWAYSPTPKALPKGAPGHAKGMRVQTLIFDPDLYSPGAARNWALRHGFVALSEATSPSSGAHRIRQVDPEHFVAGSFRTIEIRSGVKAVVGKPK